MGCENRKGLHTLGKRGKVLYDIRKLPRMLGNSDAEARGS